MKRKVLLVLMTILLPFFNGNAQTDSFSCGTDSLWVKVLETNPKLSYVKHSIKENAKLFRKHNPQLTFPPKPQPAPPCELCLTVDTACYKTRYIIPVVVHIIHLAEDDEIGDGTNIPNSQVHNGIKALNERFAAYDEDDTRAVHTGIQFFLAPVGSDTSGIFRYASTHSNHTNGDDRAQLLNLIAPEYRNNPNVINLFIVNSIEGGKYLGYATIPNAPNQVIVMDRHLVGNSLECGGCDLLPDTRGKAMAHEFGHYLGLEHTFEGGCAPEGADCETQGDGCCDTPPAETENYECPVDRNSCPQDPREDQIENIMDYTSEVCSRWFTRNQTEIMYSTLINYRRELINIEKILEYKPNICSFSARFQSNKYVICGVDTLTLLAMKYNAEGISCKWTVFDSNSNIIYSHQTSDSNTYRIILNQEGLYSVRLALLYDGDSAVEYIPNMLWVTDCESTMEHENGNWYFGSYAGLAFTESGTRPSTEADVHKTHTGNEGCISVSDHYGNLLYYGGGQGFGHTSGSLFNSRHEAMNFWEIDPLHISGTSVQGAVSFPWPADTSKRVVIQNNANYVSKASGFKYTLLQKNMQGNWEIDATNRDLPITIPGYFDTAPDTLVVSEYLSAGIQPNGIDYWIAMVVVHGDSQQYNSLTILSLDENGFSFADSAFLIKSSYASGSGTYSWSVGQVKFSPDGTKIGANNRVFDFDRETGELTKIVQLPSPWTNHFNDYPYTFMANSFSPNSRYFYFMGIMADQHFNLDIGVFRINLALNAPEANIERIGNTPIANAAGGNMQLGPDNKLYISAPSLPSLSVIENPNADIDDIIYNVHSVPLRSPNGVGGHSIFGLPNFVETLKIEEVLDTIYYTVKDCRTVVFSTTACCRSTYRWEFGDGSSQNDVKKAEHTYSHAGVYEVLLILDSGSISHDTIRVNVPLFNPKVRLFGDTLLCNQNQIEPYTALELDSFFKSYYLEWEVKDGTYSNHHSTGNTIEPNFAALPAQVIVHVIDPGSECTASDTINVDQSAEVVVNQINNGINEVILCNSVDSFNLTGSEPDGSGFYYSWYYSHNNEDWHIMGIYTQSLPAQPLDKAIYLKRLVYPDVCENWSNVVKVIPIIQNNNIYPLFPVCSEEYDYSRLLGDTLLINGDINEDFYYYKWQVSSNGYSWTDVETYKYNDNFQGYNWWYNPHAYDYYSSEEPVMFVRRAIYSYICEDFSNEVKITNYNLEEVSGIEVNPFDNTLATGLTLLGSDSLIIVTWQQSCEGDAWVDITSGYNNDTLFEIENYFPNRIRRKISKRDKNGNPIIGCDDVISYLEYGSVGMHPTNSYVIIGDSTTFYVSYNSMFTLDVQWQTYNEEEEEWIDMENENETELMVTGDLCNGQRLYRAVLSYGCFSVISDSAILTVHNSNSDFFQYIRDVFSDTAEEPNSLVDQFTYLLSPDIIANYDPTFSSVNYNWPFITSKPTRLVDGVYIHTIVRNKGTDSTKGGKLYLYASLAGANAHWDFSFSNIQDIQFLSPFSYRNYIFLNQHPFVFTVGTHVNEIGIDIPSIPPGGSKVITYYWDHAPDHFIKRSIRHPSVGVIEYIGTNTITYVARIETCKEEPHNMTYPEVFFPSTFSSLYQNVKNNARIAANHSLTIPMKGPYNSSTSLEKRPDAWNLVSNDYTVPYKIEMNFDSTDHFFNTAEMYVHFDQNLWDAFVLGGYVGSGYTIIANGIFKIDSLVPVYWDNISLSEDSSGNMGFSLHYKPGTVLSGSPVDQLFGVEFYQADELVGELFLHTQSKTNIEPSAFREDESFENLRISTDPENANNNFIFSAQPNPFGNVLHIYIGGFEQGASVVMYDINGKEVQKLSKKEENQTNFTASIPTTHLAEGVYFIRYQSNTQQVVKKVVLVR